jgi:TonB family protein
MPVRLSFAALFMSVVLPVSAMAQGQGGITTSSGYEWTAVTSTGEHLSRRQFGHKQPSWMKDLVKQPGPEYPYQARAHHWQGSGLFRIDIDVKTGVPRQVTIVHSTGTSMLDTAAMRALKKWRFKPETWKSIDIPVTFEMGYPAAIPSSGPINLPLTHGGGMRP